MEYNFNGRIAHIEEDCDTGKFIGWFEDAESEEILGDTFDNVYNEMKWLA